MRSMLAVIAALVIGGSSRSSQADPVTLELPATSVTIVLRELSLKTGLSLSAQPRLSGEVVTLVVEKMPLERLLDRLAFVLHAEVERSGKGYVVTRPANLKAKLEKEELAARAALLRQFLGRLNSDHGNPDNRAAKLLTALRKRDAESKSQRAAGKLPYFPVDDITPLSPADRKSVV